MCIHLYDYLIHLYESNKRYMPLHSFFENINTVQLCKYMFEGIKSFRNFFNERIHSIIRERKASTDNKNIPKKD